MSESDELNDKINCWVNTKAECVGGVLCNLLIFLKDRRIITKENLDSILGRFNEE